MRVFVTGASGFVGSAVVQELKAAGHQVLGLARSDASGAAIEAAGAEVLRGSLDDLDSLQRGAQACDGVIHLAYVHDHFHNGVTGQAFVDAFVAAAAGDRAAIQAMGDVLAGSDRPLVITSGTAALAPGRLGTEDDAGDQNAPGATRVQSENLAIGLASRGVRSSVVRLSPTVHGDGDHGFIPGVIGVARAKGVSAYVGEGANRWPAVHRLDAAVLFRLALERGAAGSRFHGAAEEGVALRDVATAIGRQLNVPVVSLTTQAAAEHFGWLAHFMSLDNPTSSRLTRERVGWNPTRPGLIEDLERGTYFEAAVR